MKYPSGSKLSLAMKCLGSTVLPRVDSEAGPAGQEGKRIHAALERYFGEGRSCSTDTSEDDRKTCEAVASSIGPEPKLGEQPELAIFVQAMDGVSRILRRDQWQMLSPGLHSEERSLASGGIVSNRSDPVGAEPRIYAGGDGGMSDEGSMLRRRSFVAIADLVQLIDDKRAAVWDWKSSGHVPEAEWNWQLLLPAIGLWIQSDYDPEFTCDIGILYLEKLKSHIASDERSDMGCRDGFSSRYKCTSDFLRSRFEQLKRLEQRFLTATPGNVDLYEGKHCFFCPARDRCPAKIGTLGAAIIMLGTEPNDLSIVQNHLAVKETWTSKTAMDALERNGNVMDLGDGREAVLTKDGNKRKIYTRKANGQTRPNAPEDDQSGTQGGRDSTAE